MDDDGVVHVFEAIIVGVLVLTAILFMTALSAPSQSQSSGGIDLARISADTLQILEARSPDCADEDPVPADCTYEHRLEEMVSNALRGDTEDAETFLDEVIPSGTRYLLRLDNGVEPLTLLPEGTGTTVTPRSARAAETFLMPDWTANRVAMEGAAESVARSASPGDDDWNDGTNIDLSSSPSIIAPDGSVDAPDGTTWTAWWRAWNDERGFTDHRIPSSVPYGIWKYDGSWVSIEGATQTDYPVYAVQLLVWPGA